MVNASVPLKAAVGAPALRVHSDFLDVSSYINPDASTVTTFCQRHHEVAKELLIVSEPFDPNEPSDRVNGSSLRGIPLLSPFSLGVEYEQTTKCDSPKRRTVGVTIDSLSVMVSLEDLVLIDSLFIKWSRRRSRAETRTFVYSVVFEAEKLGLGLRKEGGSIVVDHVNARAGKKIKMIEGGDSIQAINGVVVSDSTFTSLSDVVDRLASLPRPLTVTFARSLKSSPNEANDRPVGQLGSVNGELEEFQGSYDSIDVTLSSAVVTFMNHELTLFRGTVSKAEACSKLTRTDTNLSRFDLTASLEVDYYNLRLWCWEPLLELCVFSVSAELLDPLQGPKEVSIEVGDLSCGPVSVNLSDAAIETLAKLSKPDVTKGQSDGLGEGLLLDPQEFEEGYGDQALDRSVANQAANAALHFAQRQSSDSAKPFVFRNRTGVSVAFALEQEVFTSKAERVNESSFVALGEYAGLQSYSSSQVVVVANNQDFNFRVEVLPKGREGGNGRLFPSLTISLQAVEGRLVGPLQGLDISNECEATQLPISFAADESARFNSPVQSSWLSWTVEQSDERSVLTLATAIRIVSLLSKVVEIGVELGDKQNSSTFTTMHHIGSCSATEPICLPIWLCLRNQRLRCCFRVPGCRWTTLFTTNELGEVELDQLGSVFVDCQPEQEGEVRESLAIGIEGTDALLTVTLDCAVSLRNLLPASCNYEVNHENPSGELRKDFNGHLRSGDRAEVYSKGIGTVNLRIRLPPSSVWSNWLPTILPAKLEPSDTASSKMSQRIETEETQSWTQNLKIVDPFGVPLILGIRFEKKRFGGIDVMLYADLWLSNCSSLPISFGYTKEPATTFNQPRGFDPTASDVSAAEAAIREISSLFELGDEGKKLSRREGTGSQLFVVDIYQLPFQCSAAIVEECFEYIEVDSSSVIRRWWASENPHAPRDNLTVVASDGEWHWIDKAWVRECELFARSFKPTQILTAFIKSQSVDSTGRTASGWESSASLDTFSEQREFDPGHKFRRRRWVRSHTSEGCLLVDKVNGFYEPFYSPAEKIQGSDNSLSSSCFRVALKVNSGKWAMTSMIPKHGTSHGALRALKARWPRVQTSSIPDHASAFSASVYELCYAVSPLDGVWGDFSRLMLVTDRFLLRNASKSVTFEVKQCGSDDESSVCIGPGEKTPFHWSSFNIPELISVRPIARGTELIAYEWSGGFDPLSIGALPLRIRMRRSISRPSQECSISAPGVRSVQAESEIRSRTGGTGINLTFQDEDPTGLGALFRIENHSMFTIWFSQEGLLANQDTEPCTEGDLVRPSENVVFALDVPFRQGKYQGRKAATPAELLRVRLGLAPLLSQAGVETTKVISFGTSGERVRLNPSKLAFLESHLRKSLSRVRVLGVVVNDGPTRVLRFS